MFQRVGCAGHAISAAKLHADVLNDLHCRIELRLEDEEVVAGEEVDRLRRQWATAVAHAEVTTERHIGSQGSGPEPDETAATETNHAASGHRPSEQQPAVPHLLAAIAVDQPVETTTNEQRVVQETTDIRARELPGITIYIGDLVIRRSDPRTEDTLQDKRRLRRLRRLRQSSARDEKNEPRQTESSGHRPSPRDR